MGAAARTTRRRCSRTWPGWDSRRRRPCPPVGRRRAVHCGPRTARLGGPRLWLRLLALDVRGVVARARAPLARTGLSGRLPASRPGRSGAARGARRRFGTLDGCHRRTVRRRGRRRCRRPADPRSRRELDVRVRGRRRRSPPGDRPGDTRSGPAPSDAGTDPAGAPARARDTGRLRTPPAHPAAGRQQALEGRRRHLGTRPARGGPERRRPDRRGGGGGRVDRRSPPDRGDRGGGACSTDRAARSPTGLPSPRRDRGHARRSVALRSGRSTSARQAANRRTACAGSRASRHASPRWRGGPSGPAACR